MTSSLSRRSLFTLVTLGIAAASCGTDMAKQAPSGPSAPAEHMMANSSVTGDTAVLPVTTPSFPRDLSPGWNLGNTLEAIGSGSQPFTTSQETVWGNPVASQALMNSVKAAGFRSVRIPVSWTQYADANGTISPFWLDRVSQVVNYARNAGLYVIINVHWDGGWMQPTYAQQAAVNAKLTKFWAQIAHNFQTYDNHLLFAGTNEVMVTGVYSTPTAENCAVQNSFNQTFVDTVRADGGNNTSRYLVVQGYNTNIDNTLLCNTNMPTDSAANKLLMEIHYYDPYDFTLNTDSSIWQWGNIATSPANTQTWANEAYTDAQFQKIKVNFVDKGIPVILGEYAASLRTEYDVPQTYRNYWDQYITRSAYAHGIAPIYWDSGYLTNHASGLFNRSTGAQGYPATISAIVDEVNDANNR